MTKEQIIQKLKKIISEIERTASIQTMIVIDLINGIIKEIQQDDNKDDNITQEFVVEIQQKTEETHQIKEQNDEQFTKEQIRSVKEFLKQQGVKNYKFLTAEEAIQLAQEKGFTF